MAATTFFAASRNMVAYGRSGYNNKPDEDDEPKNQGRSGYNNKPDDDDETKNKGRSGYNKGGKDDDEDDK